MSRAHAFHKAMAQVHKRLGAPQPLHLPKAKPMSKAEPELTEWFPGEVKPWRRGVYQREYPGGAVHYCRFDLRNWFVMNQTAASAAREYGPSATQDLPWRGLVKESK